MPCAQVVVVSNSSSSKTLLEIGLKSSTLALVSPWDTCNTDLITQNNLILEKIYMYIHANKKVRISNQASSQSLD